MNRNHNHPPDLRNCLDRRFKLAGASYAWQSTVGMFEVCVNAATTNTGNYLVHVHMRDPLSDLVVEEWSSSVRCHHCWRDRLQEQVGKALIRTYHRPACPRCSNAGERVTMLVKNLRRTRNSSSAARASARPVVISRSFSRRPSSRKTRLRTISVTIQPLLRAIRHSPKSDTPAKGLVITHIFIL